MQGKENGTLRWQLRNHEMINRTVKKQYLHVSSESVQVVVGLFTFNNTVVL